MGCILYREIGRLSALWQRLYLCILVAACVCVCLLMLDFVCMCVCAIILLLFGAQVSSVL